MTRPPVGPLANAAAALVNNRQPPGARPERRPPVSGGPLPGGPPVSGGPPPGWLPGQSMNDEANPFSGSPPSSGGFAGFGSPMSQFFGQTAPTMAGAPAPLPGLGGGFGPGMLQALGLGGVMPHAANPFAAPTPPPQNRPGTGAWGIGGASGGAPGGNAGGTPFAGSSGGFGGAAFGGGPQGSPFNQLFLQQLMGVNNNSQLQGVPMTSGGLF